MKIDAISPEFMEINPPQKAPSFGQWLTEQLSDTHQKLVESDQALQSLAKGESQNLHQVMIQLEQAKLSLQLVEQVRSRTLNAYQEILKEQI